MRAIKRKIAECRKNGRCEISQRDENSLLKLVHIHYSRCCVLYGRSDDELREHAFAELSQFFNDHQNGDIYRYLLQNWYDLEYWIIWGRRHTSKLALSRTTKKVEAHWLVLKRLCLLPYNRPQVDRFAALCYFRKIAS